jgi:hypothetical protein
LSFIAARIPLNAIEIQRTKWNGPANINLSPACKLRVHIDKTTMRKAYKYFSFHFDDTLMEIFPRNSLSKTWRQETPWPSFQRLGANWVKSASSVKSAKRGLNRNLLSTFTPSYLTIFVLIRTASPNGREMNCAQFVSG